ncbi:hypothetical protein RJ639_015871 [Escallonia herrerae]|uniref:Uncharacterized protein n=1 Tax=Escallonia herrerae TaxID=1293975 RepID=A0AA89AIV1_9ASTE|nr:hypothetical protein RJ639_015871 [Escallonia herrerae]
MPAECISIGRLQLSSYNSDNVVNYITPRIFDLSPNFTNTFPHYAVTLEPTPEGNLPYLVTPSHPSFGFHVAEFIPDGRRGSVAEPVKSHCRGLDVLLRQLQALFNGQNHGSSSCMYAEMLESSLEIWHQEA